MTIVVWGYEGDQGHKASVLVCAIADSESSDSWRGSGSSTRARRCSTGLDRLRTAAAPRGVRLAAAAAERAKLLRRHTLQQVLRH